MAAAEMTLAAVLAMSAHFQTGAEALKQLDFEKAETEAAAIIEVAPTNSVLSEAARIMRAKARVAMRRKEDALQDLRWVGQRSENPGLRAEALTMFEQLAEGRASTLLPQRSPRTEFYRILSDVRRGGAESAVQRVGGPLREWIDAAGANLPEPAEGQTRAGNALKALAPEWLGVNARPADERIDAAAGKAELTVLRNSVPYVFTMRQSGDSWMLWGIKSMPAPAAAGDTNAAASAGANVAAAGPAAAQALAQAAMANVQFRAMGGMAQGVAVINGQVIHLGGDGGMIQITSSSSASPTNAVADVSTNEVPAEKRAEISKLIGELGAPDAAARAKARTRLKEMGAVARPFLRERTSDPDVEIATTVRELLGE